MALYLGSGEKLNINLDGILYRLNSFPENSIRLSSYERLLLKDSNGLYLTVKESE